MTQTGDHSDLEQALDYIDPSALDYSGWVSVGMALHESGLTCELWDSWSRRDPARYHEGECASKWKGFGNGMERVHSGTVVAMARANGWTPRAAVEDRAIGWDDEVTLGPDPTWVEPSEITSSGKPPTTQLYEYIQALFDDDDWVGYVTESYVKDGRTVPKNAGHQRKASELLDELARTSNLDYVIGDWNGDAGAWIRFNPLDGKGYGNANVTEFRYALVESDELPIEKQKPMIEAMNLPCVAIVLSGGKSVHAIVRVDAGDDYGLYRKRVERLYSYCRAHGFEPDTQNKNPSRLSRMPGVNRGESTQELLATNVGAESWQAWEDWVAESEDDLPDAESLFDRLQRAEPLSEPIIGTEERGLLRRGHKMLVQGPSKAGKSMLLMELAIAMATGSSWIGYQCRKGRVLYVNLEIDPPSLDCRFRQIAQDVQTSGTSGTSWARNIDVWNLRGKSCPMDVLAPRLIRRMAGKGYSMVIIDPLYKVITGDENSASEMASFCNQFDKVAAQTGASVVYCHHHSKGFQGTKKAIDRGSGSGVFGRDPDAILDVAPLEIPEKRERELGNTTCWRVSVTLREFAPPSPIDLFYRYPVHLTDSVGELAKFKVEGEDPYLKNREKRDRARKEKEDAAHEKIVEIMREAIESCASDGVSATRKNVLERIAPLNDKAVTKGQVESWTTPTKTKWTPFTMAKNGDGLSVVVESDQAENE